MSKIWKAVLASDEFKADILAVIRHTAEDLAYWTDMDEVEIDPDTGEPDEDSAPWQDLTVGMNTRGEWSWQTGDNSFTGAAYGYPHWAVVSIGLHPSDLDMEDTYEEIVSQLADLMSQ